MSARRVRTITIAGIATSLAFSALTAAASAATSAAPPAVVATITGTTARIAWSPAAPAGTLVTVSAVETGRGTVGQRMCDGCSAMTWEGLRGGQTYTFTVATRSAGADGPATSAAPVTATDPLCGTTATCVSVDTTGSSGTEQHPAIGFLHGLGGNSYPPLARALHPAGWRVDAGERGAARTSDTAVEEVLSDDWVKDNGFTNPWASWSRYRAWTTATVQAAKASGDAPTYWDIQNEPSWDQWSYDPTSPPTTDLVLQQFATAYAAIKAADPNAKVEGPSMPWSFDDPRALLDLRRFLEFCAANDIRLDRITWHELGNGETFDGHPAAIADHAATVRAFVDQLPELGHPDLAVNEYSGGYVGSSPGWLAGYFASIDHGNIAAGNHSCWGADQCYALPGVLDGILTSDSRATEAYWTYASYAAMVGQRALTATTNDRLSALATVDAQRVTKILVGRDEACPTSACPGATPSLPVTVTIAVRLPAGVSAVSVSAQRLTNTSGAGAPVPLLMPTATVSGGIASIRVPLVGDGSALSLTLTPGAGASNGLLRSLL